MMTLLKVLLIIAIVVVALFVVLFTVYFLNLDMKLTAALFPLFEKHYDKMKREKKL